MTSGRRYGDARRTEINYMGGDFSDEDMIADDAMVITVSREGYIKRTNLDEYRAQGRGGMGSRGVSTKKDDFTAAPVCGHDPRVPAVFHRAGPGVLAQSVRSAGGRQGPPRACPCRT